MTPKSIISDAPFLLTGQYVGILCDAMYSRLLIMVL
jgi:hypothetical protein